VISSIFALLDTSNKMTYRAKEILSYVLLQDQSNPRLPYSRAQWWYFLNKPFWGLNLQPFNYWPRSLTAKLQDPPKDYLMQLPTQNHFIGTMAEHLCSNFSLVHCKLYIKWDISSVNTQNRNRCRHHLY